MRKFCCIIIFIVCSQSFAKESLCQSYYVPEDNDVVAFTVPENKEFVLLLLYVQANGQWQIDVNDSMFLMCSINLNVGQNPTTLQFPDDIAVISSGKTLTLKNTTFAPIYYTIAGYYRDINPLAGDLNDNGIVNFADFAMLAEDWLEGSM